MLQILFLILKIIGIVLLALLAILLLVLFFPIIYKGKGVFDEEQKEFKLIMHWLLHLLHFSLVYNQEKVEYSIKLFGCNIMKYNRNNDGEVHDKFKTDDESAGKEPEEGVVSHKEEEIPYENCTDADTYDDIEEKRASTSKESKFKIFFKNLNNKFTNINDKIKKFVKKVKLIIKKWQEFLTFIKSENTKIAYNYGKEKIIKLLRHIKPRKLKANIKFGFETPDKTGISLGAIGSFCGMAGINPDSISIESDFENKVFKGEIEFKGRFMVAVIVITVLQLYFKKEINDIIKMFELKED